MYKTFLEIRLNTLLNGKRRLQKLEDELNRINWTINEISNKTFGHTFSTVSCATISFPPPETDEQRKVRESKERLYRQMVKPYEVKLKANEKLQKQILRTMHIKREWDGEGYEITYDNIDTRIKEIKQLLEEI